MAAAVDSVAAVAVALVESAIAGKRLTLIEQAKGCHESMAPFFVRRRHPAMCHAWGGGLLRCEVRAVSSSGEVRTEPPCHAPR